ncbi:GntR family transcriptional regulator [Mycolicibacterium septicum]|uniref:GntR family transcriptional regulator n=1 Tax=Mycolicibacterium septicum TaxID=98668 RepID=UPI002360D57A|nr:GntR family transcriptional regulator [Mycolicibacterium septicum]
MANATFTPTDDPDPVSGDEPANSTAQAFDAVRRAIINADLPPGSVVSQVQLAAQLNISRTPLREALRRLQSEGLLEGDFNRRLRVAPLTVADLEQVAAMRIVLESLGVQISVPQLAPSRLDRATEAFEQMDRVWTTTGSLDDFRVPHRVFHTTLFSAAGVRIQCRLEELWDHSERYRTIYGQTSNDPAMLATIAHDEHAAILHSAHERDAQGCGRLIAAHLARTALTTLAKLDPTHDPTIIRQATVMATGSAGNAAPIEAGAWLR